AYVDRFVLNLHAGPGQTEVWIDDLEIGPVVDSNPPQSAATPGTPGVPGAVAAPTGRPIPRRPAVVDLDRDQLLVSGKRFFVRAIRHTDTPLKVLRDAGFNTIWLDESATPATLEEAVSLGFWIGPALPLAGDEPPAGPNTYLTSRVNFNNLMTRFLEQDAVLFWDLGHGGLSLEQASLVSRTAQLVKAADPTRPLSADVWDGFAPYSRTLNLVGVHRWPLMTSLELTQYYTWLAQRHNLANPGTFMWTWVQTHLPEWHTNLVYGRPGTASFEEPVGPLPEQIRLLTYTAVASGCRGLGFWSDRFL